MEASRNGLQHCCWCGKPQLLGAFDKENAVSEEENDVTLLLELLGVSTSLLIEDIVYRMCSDCTELVSYGTDLKIQSELEKDVSSRESCRRQLEQVEKDLKDRAQNVPFMLAKKNNSSLGFQLSKCFSECFVQLQLLPEDEISRFLEHDNQPEFLACVDDIKVEISCASPVKSEPDSSFIKYEIVSSDEEICDILALTHDSTRSLSQETSSFSKVTDSKVDPEDKVSQNVATEVKVELMEMMAKDEDNKHSLLAPFQPRSTGEVVIDISSHTDVPVSETFECCGCPEVFASRKDRFIHEKKHTNVRNGRVVFKCDECGRVVLSSYHLRSHRRSHKQGSCVCDVCGMIFLNMKFLQTHRRKVHNLKIRLKCKTCNKNFFTQTTLSRHETICGKRSQKTGGGSGSPDDQQIAASTGNQSEDIATKKAAPTAGGQYECGGCLETFDTNSAMLDHEKTHVVVKDEGRILYKCNICEMELSTLYSVKVHSKVHSKIHPLCKICGKTYTSKLSLKQHMNVHDPENVYKCEFCDSQFSASGQLVTHRRIHTGEKPYSCELCDKTFARSDKLIIHRRLHTGEQPFECEICKRRFSRSETFKQHLKAHTGERPFSCDRCGETFIKKSSLISHHKRQQEDEKFGVSVKRDGRGRKPKQCIPKSKSLSAEDVPEAKKMKLMQ